MLKAARSLGVLTGIWILGSCGGGDAITGPTLATPATPAAPLTAAVTLSQDTATLVPTGVVQLSATAKDQSGLALARTITWSSSDTTKAKVSTTGLVTAVAPGTAVVTAAAEGRVAGATIVIREGGIVSDVGGALSTLDGAARISIPAGAFSGATSVSIVPASGFGSDPVQPVVAYDFGPSGTVFTKPAQLTIKYDPSRLPSGTEESALELFLRTSSGWDPVAGSAVNTSDKTVSAPISHFSTYAILPPVAVADVVMGSTSVAITAGALSLTVEDTASLTATPKDATGRTLTGRALSWSSSDSTVARVSAAGLITALKAGTSTVSATAGGKTSNVTVTVAPIPVASVTLAGSSALLQGDTARISAVTLDAKARTLTGRTVTWATSAAGVATVTNDGLVTAVAPGTADITATSEGKSAKLTVTVSLRPVASVILSFPSQSLFVGATSQGSVTLKDDKGTVLSGRTVDWASTNTAVATVSSSGLVTAVSAGTTSVSATSEGKSSSSVITVSLVPVATVSVSLASASVNVGATTQATATMKDASGAILSGRAVTWASSDPSVATVSTSGLVTAVSVGSASITATSEGKTGSATVSTKVVPVATVSVSLASNSIDVGATSQATATTKDAGGNTLTGRTVTWSSSATSVATVSSSGLVTAVAAGSASITATSEGQTGSATITVTNAPLNLTIDGMYVVQAIQTYSRRVPLVRDRDAYLRVFVKANTSNTAAGQVRVRLYMNGALFQTSTVSIAASSVPTSVNEGDARSSVNIKILGSNVQPGLSVLADVDPSNTIAESNEADNQYPSSGTPLAIDVRSTAPANVTFIPILQSVNGLQGNVTTGNAASFMDLANRIHPFASSGVLVHSVYTTSAAELNSTDSNNAWNQILSEVNALQVAEGTGYNYYGIVKVTYSSGVAGVAYVEGKSGIGVDWGSGVGARVFAHEIGHNWGMLHAPCGNPASVDPSYPYSGGGINFYGVDVAGDSLITPADKYDVMSYCTPQWISDYTFKSILNYRATAAQPTVISAPSIQSSYVRASVTSDPTRSLGGFTGSSVTGTTSMSVQPLSSISAIANGATEPCTIVWGRVTASGLVLEPSFASETHANLPSGAGPFTFEALDASGARVFSFSFRPDSVADSRDGTRMFAFAIPDRMLNSAVVQKMRLSGEGRSVEISSSIAAPTAPNETVTATADAAGKTRVSWDSDRFPLLVIRDANSGAIVSLARGGNQVIAAPLSSLEFSLSDAIHSKVGAAEIR